MPKIQGKFLAVRVTYDYTHHLSGWSLRICILNPPSRVLIWDPLPLYRAVLLFSAENRKVVLPHTSVASQCNDFHPRNGMCNPA